MVILNKHCFKLPRIEKGEFISLLKLGLGYNRDQGCYFISSYNNIGKLVDTLSSILNTEKITFLQSCIICSKDFSCSNCKYIDLCTTKDLPFECVCPHCLNEGRAHPDMSKTKRKGDLSDYF
jgi:hypothetical protein